MKSSDISIPPKQRGLHHRDTRLAAIIVVLGFPLIGAAPPGPALPEFNIDQECGNTFPGALLNEQIADCRKRELDAHAFLQDNKWGKTWDNVPADLRDYCLNYFLPRWRTYVSNTGGTHTNYQDLVGCALLPDWRGHFGGPTPWLDENNKMYMGPYKNDAGSYYPGWKNK
jgi:hypothetical protein